MKLDLVALDLNKKIKMKIDTLDYTMGGVLSMECGNGWWRLINIPLKISQ